MNKAKTETFRNAPVKTAVFKNAIPAMLAMVMVLVYNLADTFFIGQTGDALQVAAVSVATPVFMIFMTFGTMFGIGGTSLISRSLGAGRQDYARHVCAFCAWGCIVSGIAFFAFVMAFMEPILYAIGASANTFGLARSYLVIVCCSGPLVIFGNCYSNILRAEGESTKGVIGMLLGNLVNIVLDPIFILVLGMGIQGAAIATVIGNVCGAAYYLLYFLSGKSSLSISPRQVRLGDGIFSGVMAIGIPAAIGDLLMSVSQLVMNSQMTAYGDMAIAGIGVAMKVTMITGCLCIGLGQGVQPILGYCVGARLEKRYHEVLRFSMVFALATSTVLAVLCFLFTPQIVGAFLTETAAYDDAVQFARILLTTSFLFGAYYVILNALQAMGSSTASLVVNVSRQGLIYIPALFILQAAFGETGLVWAQPVADVASLALSIGLYFNAAKHCWKQIAAQKPNSEQPEEQDAEKIDAYPARCAKLKTADASKTASTTTAAVRQE
ncbi:MAG: MATE family efflux transporter [Coriobacteriales bacterium]|jgi:multidrug efflux pump